MQTYKFADFAKEVVRHNDREERYASDLQKLSGVYMFISIDLVNSTIFKTRYTEYWSFVIQTFYNIVTTALGAEDAYRGLDVVEYVGTKAKFDSEKMKTGGFKVWKLVGDEVLLYHKIVSISEILNTVRIMYYITENIRELFITHGKKFFKGNDEEFENFERVARRQLMAKTTIWCAKCGTEGPSIEYPNIFYDTSNYMNISENCLDFLGPDIDAGFRLCSYAEKNKVIVSPNLVALLSVQKERKEEIELNGEIENCYRIVSYVELEDIWDKRLYPIFLYCPCNMGTTLEKQTKWEKLFEYDEIASSKLSGLIFSDEKFYEDKKYSYHELDRIYGDLGRNIEIKNLKEDFVEQINTLQETKNIVQQWNHRFEFHISCVCYYEKEEKIWIEKHENHGLSFGCKQIDVNNGYIEKIVKFYKEKHNVEITNPNNLEFLTFYSLYRNNKMEEILGVLFLADAKPKTGLTAKQENGWYGLKSIEKISKTHKKIDVFDDVIKMIKNNKKQ